MDDFVQVAKTRENFTALVERGDRSGDTDQASPTSPTNPFPSKNGGGEDVPSLDARAIRRGKADNDSGLKAVETQTEEKVFARKAENVIAFEALFAPIKKITLTLRVVVGEVLERA